MTIIVTALTALLFGAAVASAAPSGNPHFIKKATTASLDGTDLVVQFKEAGLASGQQVFIQADAHLEATYSCVNNGGNVPVDAKKTTISSEVSYGEPFTAGRNGQVVGSLTLSAPAPADALSCPPGQTATLFDVEWSNIVVTLSLIHI